MAFMQAKHRNCWRNLRSNRFSRRISLSKPRINPVISPISDFVAPATSSKMVRFRFGTVFAFTCLRLYVCQPYLADVRRKTKIKRQHFASKLSQHGLPNFLGKPLDTGFRFTGEQNGSRRKNYRNRSRHHELGRCRHGRKRTYRDRQPRG